MENTNFIVEKTERVSAIIESDLISLLPDFIKNRNEDLRLINSYIETKNFDGIRKMGHDLRGVPGAFGYDFLVDLGYKIEMAARNQELNTLIDLARRYDKLMKTHDIIIEGDDKIYHCEDFL
jgi:HPt (histidine-containing phosphotransfer) domain-containing protein